MKKLFLIVPFLLWGLAANAEEWIGYVNAGVTPPWLGGPLDMIQVWRDGEIIYNDIATMVDIVDEVDTTCRISPELRYVLTPPNASGQYEYGSDILVVGRHLNNVVSIGVGATSDDSEYQILSDTLVSVHIPQCASSSNLIAQDRFFENVRGPRINLPPMFSSVNKTYSIFPGDKLVLKGSFLNRTPVLCTLNNGYGSITPIYTTVSEDGTMLTAIIPEDYDMDPDLYLYLPDCYQYFYIGDTYKHYWYPWIATYENGHFGAQQLIAAPGSEELTQLNPNGQCYLNVYVGNSLESPESKALYLYDASGTGTELPFAGCNWLERMDSTGWVKIEVTDSMYRHIFTNNAGFALVAEGEVPIRAISYERHTNTYLGCMGYPDSRQISLPCRVNWSSVVPGDTLRIQARCDFFTPSGNMFTLSDDAQLISQTFYFTEDGLPETGSSTRVENRVFNLVITEDLLNAINQDGDRLLVTGHGTVLQSAFIRFLTTPDSTASVSLWKGSENVDFNGTSFLSDGATELLRHGVSVGDCIRLFIIPTSDEWWINVYTGHWEQLLTSAISSNMSLPSEGGYVSFVLTQNILNLITEPQGWGSTFVMQGENVLITDIQWVNQEVVLWSGRCQVSGWESSFSGLTGHGIDWSGLSAGKTLQIQVEVDDAAAGGAMAKVIDATWNTLPGFLAVYGETYSLPSSATSISFTLTEEDVAMIQSYGMMCAGDGYVVTRVILQ